MTNKDLPEDARTDTDRAGLFSPREMFDKYRVSRKDLLKYRSSYEEKKNFSLVRETSD